MSRIRFALPFALALTILAASPASAAPGDLDPTFGNGGKREIAFGPFSSNANALVVTPDQGAVLVGGVFTGDQQPALARVDRNGRPVRSFGNNGRVIVSAPGVATTFQDVARQGSKYLAVGTDQQGPTDPDFVTMRFNADGSLDGTFGDAGVAQTDFGRADRSFALVVLPDNRFVVVGDSGPAFAFARYTPNGQLDPTFGNNGRRRVAFPGRGFFALAVDVAARPGGGVVAVGRAEANQNEGVWAIAALNASGTPDPSFSGDGRVTLDLGPQAEHAQAVAVRQSKILVGGAVRFQNPPDTQAAVARLMPDGSLDPTYGDGGVSVFGEVGNSEFLEDLAIGADGRAYAAGSDSFAGFLVRLTQGGDLDPTFGQGGYAELGFTGGEDLYGVALDAVGRALAAGNAGNPQNMLVLRVQT